MRVTAFREGVIRVRLAPNGGFAPDASWAVAEEARPPALTIDDGVDAVNADSDLI